MTKDYHDYVFKDGKLVGEFDEMYKNCDNPWNMNNILDTIETKICYNIIGEKKYNNILDIGCGKGHITNLYSQLSNNIVGIDISSEVIKQSKSLFPNIEFQVCNIMDGLESNEFVGNKKYDLICFLGVFWYVLEKIDFIFEDINDHLNEEGVFLFSVSFYENLFSQEKYCGKDRFSNEKDILELVKKYFNVKERVIVNHIENKDIYYILKCEKNG